MKVSCANEYKIHSVSVVYGGIRHNLECEGRHVFPLVLDAIHKIFVRNRK